MNNLHRTVDVIKYAEYYDFVADYTHIIKSKDALFDIEHSYFIDICSAAYSDTVFYHTTRIYDDYIDIIFMSSDNINSWYTASFIFIY